MNQKRAYKFRWYPSEEQKRILARTFGCCRWVYNWALRTKTDAYTQNQQRLSTKDLSAMLTDLKQAELSVIRAVIIIISLLSLIRLPK